MQETQRLDQIDVESLVDTGPNPGWQRIRQYRFNYDYSTLSDYSDDANGNAPDPGSAKLTLTGVTRVGDDGANYVPGTAFTYGATRGTAYYPNGDWNRLTVVDNGQGGKLTFAYEDIGLVHDKWLFRNFRRVTSKKVEETTAATAIFGTWTYAYGVPELNSLGAEVDSDWNSQWQQHPNSAALYLNRKWTGASATWLAHPQNTEFRGHSWTFEIAPNGTETERFFYQGDTNDRRNSDPSVPECTPTVSGNNLADYEADACFVRLRTNEFLRGRAYRTVVTGPASAGRPPYADTVSSFVVQNWDYAQNVITGLWQHYAYTDTTTTTTEPGSGGITMATATTRDGWGNPTSVREYPDANTAGTPYRRTDRQYTAAVDTVVAAMGAGGYLAPRLAQASAYDGGGTERARARTFYDGSMTLGTLGTKGDVTQTKAYYDLTTGSEKSADVQYGYDAFGNRTSVTTFTGPNAQAGTDRTTQTAYDPTYHDLPITVTAPTVGGVTLVEQAGYDPRMRTMTSVTGVNGAATTVQATYDLYGRLVALVKPGDSLSYPTLRAYYYDWQRPVHYVVERRETSGATSTLHYAQVFTDGLGRTVQTKREAVAGTVNTVADTQYDAMGVAYRSSQPRDVTEQSSPLTFWDFTARASDPAMRWTTTAYDALARPTTVTLPDSTTTQAAYAISGTGTAAVHLTTATDANAHRTARATDRWGRLVAVTEYSGNGGAEGSYATYATTSYQYDILDRMTDSTDAQSNHSGATFDALGRTLSSSDPDMGSRSYQYDAMGNLKQRTDAKAQITTYAYDALDRLTATGGAVVASFTYDSIAGGNLGKGMRTGTSNGAGQTATVYDARGRVTGTTLSAVPGTTGSWTITTAYNAADKPTSVQYPTGETVSYSYDAAWRQTQACTSLGGCYAASATLTALDQPSQWTLQNGLVAQWIYAGALNRLQQTRVGTASTPGGTFDRSYTYDQGGNVANIRDGLSTTEQRFTYDHRDRLTHACTASTAPGSQCSAAAGSGGYDETYSYDLIGNFTSKAGVAYTYTGSGHAHAPKTVGAETYTYDANGNTLTGGGRTITWDARDLPTSVSSAPLAGTPAATEPPRAEPTVAGVPNKSAAARAEPTVAGVPNKAAPTRGAGGGGGETYTYDADGARLTRTASGITTLYVGGVYEVDLQGTTTLVTRSQYAFNGRVIAQRTSTGSTPLVFLHGDHLGSISVATNGSGALLDRQEYDPWGKVRSGGVPETTLNFTGQKRDATGLLYYGARYYDPAIGRFLSADTMGVRITHPQSLNRYAYVLNNPLKLTDPSGHCSPEDGGCEYGRGDDEPPGGGGGGGGGIGGPPDMSGGGEDCCAPDDSGDSTGLVGAAFSNSYATPVKDMLTTSPITIIADPPPPEVDLCMDCNPPPQPVIDPCSDCNPPPQPDLPKCCFDPVPQPTTGGMLINTPTADGLPAIGAGPGMVMASGGVPNPNGKKGGPEHQRVIGEEADKGEDAGLIVIGGGGRESETKIDTNGGYKNSRYADVTFVDPDTGKVSYVNVGRSKVDGSPIARKQRALEDIRAKGHDIRFVPYDR